MPKTTILIIEYNQIFYKRLAEKYKGEKNLHTINGSAENLNHYMRIHNIPYADAIVSDQPFASLPQEMSDSILASARDVLHEEGKSLRSNIKMENEDDRKVLL
ncbi:hypothetical protein [Fictibacillus sp. NRS-1165]|uniref:hypothetical protein n=1 Tax=Fictibacillus sp. NRS-1165 TaxID=3144463 RepID=UPI003D1E5073